MVLPSWDAHRKLSFASSWFSSTAVDRRRAAPRYARAGAPGSGRTARACDQGGAAWDRSQRRESFPTSPYGCGWVSTGDGGCAPMRALCCCLLRITFGVESANLNTWSVAFYGAGSSAISDVIFIAENGSWDSPTRRFLHIARLACSRDTRSNTLRNSHTRDTQNTNQYSHGGLIAVKK